ncbi:MAG: alpha/beta hydrolase [Pirellulales bacterium]|nr:alpha/beta hydrolase [Pirellulales bacterium]
MKLRKAISTLIALIVLLAVTRSLASDRIALGSASFQFVDRLGNADKPIVVWTHAPRALKPKSAIVFVMHGMRRNGREYRDQWVRHAEAQRFLLIVPEFSEQAYSDEAYQRGNMFDDQGRAIDPTKWTFTAIEHLFDYVREAAGNRSEQYYLYGHSAGGQVVQRLVMFLPQARFKRAIAANPGYYTLPEAGAFPYGLDGTTASDETLRQGFARDFVLLLGDADTDRDDPNLRKTAEADRQGQHRFERGQFFFERARQRAAALDADFHWQKRTVRGAGHSDKQMSQAAVTALFAR